MATRAKTIKYSFPTYTTVLTNNTTTNLNQITIYIPETVINFKSVFVDIGFRDIATAAGSIATHSAGLQIGASGYTTITPSGSIAQSGENMGGVIGPIDFTSLFTSDWSGTSMTCDLQCKFNQNTGTTLGMRNVTGEITITYEYDDTEATQIKTVQIPLESIVGSLPTVANSSFGTNQIPQLTGAGGICPEQSVSIKDYYFVIDANSATSSTTDFTVSANIDSGTSFSFGLEESALVSNTFGRLIYKPSVPDTSSDHNFQLWCSVAGRLNHACVTLVITYEFALSGTTSMLNSITIPIELASPIGIPDATAASRFSREFFIEEENPVLVSSSFRIHFNTTASVAGMRWRAGSQSYKLYTHYANTACGMFCLQQKIDSSSSGGAGISIAKGNNSLIIDGYSTDTIDQLTNVSGFLLINYISDVPSGGIGAASHTIEKVLTPWSAALKDRNRNDSFTLAIPETDYWLVSTGFSVTVWMSAGSCAVTFDVECLTGEAKGGGYYDIYADGIQTDGERACTIIWMRGRDVFKKFPEDPDPDRLDLFSSRSYRWFSSTTAATGVKALATYHSISYTSTLTIANSNGGTVNIDVFRYDNDEKILSTSRVGNGDVDLKWYDNTLDVYVVCYEDSTHIGRSANFKMGD